MPRVLRTVSHSIYHSVRRRPFAVVRVVLAARPRMYLCLHGVIYFRLLLGDNSVALNVLRLLTQCTFSKRAAAYRQF